MESFPLLAGGEVQDHRGLRSLRLEGLQEPPQGGVAAGEAVVAPQGAVDSGALDPGFAPGHHLVAERLDQRAGGRLPPGTPQGLGQRRIIGQGVLSIEPA